jgi:hypothetical protein
MYSSGFALGLRVKRRVGGEALPETLLEKEESDTPSTGCSGDHWGGILGD